jgi:hypothetical protein
MNVLLQTFKNQMHSTCTVYPYSYADDNGQPVYDTARTVICAMRPGTTRTYDGYGDMYTVSGVKVMLPGDDPIQVKDKIVLPSPYDLGAVISMVNAGMDLKGNTIFKEVVVS